MGLITSLCMKIQGLKSFPCRSAGKEYTCNAGDPSLIPGSERSTGEGIVYPLQHSWASLMAQLVKNPPAMRETWVWSLGWEDSLEKVTATGEGQYSGLEKSMDCTVHGVIKSRTWLSNFHFQSFYRKENILQRKLEEKNIIKSIQSFLFCRK